MMSRRIIPAALGLLAVVLSGCNVSKTSNPLSPSIAGPIPGVVISQPKLLEPTANTKFAVDNQPVTLVIENAATNGVRPLSYVFEVAIDADFTNKVFVREGVAPGEGGRTSVQLPDRLAPERTYYWRARALDGANSGSFASGIHFNVYTPIVIGGPVLRSPDANATISTVRPNFVISNAPRSGPVGAMLYQFVFATSIDFSNRVAVWQDGEDSGQTTSGIPVDLNHATVYYWRARAADPTTVGPWSGVWAFVTPEVVVTPGPVNPGGPCVGSTALEIMECARSHYGSPLSKSDHINFLRESARNMNAAGIPSGPFGVLRKSGGNNCEGYSCDIICAGQGSSQLQWDVLVDETYPAWGSPKTINDDIRVDVCEIQ